MTRAITFTPGARSGADPQDIQYIEHASRNRSVHALFQDTAGRSESRHHYLLKAYGELVARFGGYGRIEHPLPFLRGLTRALEQLGRRADCRVDDFAGLGVYVLLRDAASFYLLASREGVIRVDAGDGFVPFDSVPWVRELPLETSGAQKELFARTMRDYIALYRIDPPVPPVPTAPEETTLHVVMGGQGSDADTVVESLREPGASSGAGDRVDHQGIARSVLAVEFPPAQPVRDPVLDALRLGETNDRPRLRRVVVAAATTLVFAMAATLWISSSGIGDRSAETAQSDPAVAASASQEASPRLEEVPAQETPQDAALVTPEESAAAEPVDDAGEPVEIADVGDIGMTVSWRRNFDRPVTTTPVVDGDAVIFGSRDGHVYSLDRHTGEGGWSYDASDGVGASPVVSGGVVLGADYRGAVFCLDKESGEAVWTQSLPDRVVSTPCVSGGEVLVGCTDGFAYGLSLETGRILWKVETGGKIRGSATTAAGRFYLTSYDGNVYAIAPGNGAVQWKHQIGGQLTSTPAADDSRVVAGADGGIFGIDAATGKRLWRFRTRAPVRSFISMEGDRVYAGCNDGNVYCLDATSGEQVWKASTGDVVLSRPRLEGGLLFVTSYDKSVYCFNAATGERVADYATGGSIYSSPVVHGDFLFFGNNEGEFYCINYRSRNRR